MEVPAPSRLGTRRGLLFSTLPAVSVLAVLGVLLALGHYRSTVRDRHAEIRILARAAAEDARRFVDGQIATLSAMAGAPAVRRLDWHHVRPYLRTVARSAGFTGGIGLVGPDGRLRVSSARRLPAGGVPLRRPFVRAAFEDGRPGVSNALVGRMARGPVVAFAYPVIAPAGRRTGVLTAAMLLEDVDQVLDRLLYAADVGETVLDGAGHVLVGPRPVDGIERPPLPLPLESMRAAGDGVLDGVESPRGTRLIGYATVQGTPWLVVVDQARAAVIGPLDRALWAELVALALFFCLGALAVLTGARRLQRLDALREEALTEQRDIAVRLQRSLLPDVPGPAELEVHAAYAPAQGTMAVGGDWYDVVELGDGRVALSVGDVAGHGLPAAAAMGQLRSAVRTLALARTAPGDALSQLDRFAATLHGGPLATVVYAVVDARSGAVRYAAAGHPPPIVVRVDGTTQLLTEGRSPLLGVAATAPRPEGETRLRPGDTLVFYTDGLVERPEASIDHGIAILAARAGAAAARDPAALADHLVDGVGEPRRDDTAVLCARLPPA